jgi:hypothetical protein
MSTSARIGIRATRFLAVHALALAMVIGSAAVANAVPDWDIDFYDRCMASYTDEEILADPGGTARYCCDQTYGVWDSAIGKCVAPPAESQSGRMPLTEAPTHVLTPSQPEQVPGGVLTPGA